ncbi:MAG: amino acid--tRNA ligase-related protein [Acetivibrionales bacterium]
MPYIGFFQDRGFVYVHTPIITSSDCEGAGEMFQVDHFGSVGSAQNSKWRSGLQPGLFRETYVTYCKRASLLLSPYAMAFGKVYTFGPTFRAENSNTTRHAAEFWMIEPEIAFADLEDDMRLAEDMIRYIISYVMENAKEEMDFFNSFIDKGLYVGSLLKVSLVVLQVLRMISRFPLKIHLTPDPKKLKNL